MSTQTIIENALTCIARDQFTGLAIQAVQQQMTLTPTQSLALKIIGMGSYNTPVADLLTYIEEGSFQDFALVAEAAAEPLTAEQRAQILEILRLTAVSVIQARIAYLTQLTQPETPPEGQ